MGLLQYNEQHEHRLQDYNCAGFALGTFNWYEPPTWGDAKYDWELIEDEQDVLDSFVDGILSDFPHLIPIDSPRNVPKRFRIIGFRFGYHQDSDEIDDFHFIVRHKGVWYHKPGSWAIERFNKRKIRQDWVGWNVSYTSDIAWFIDPR